MPGKHQTPELGVSTERQSQGGAGAPPAKPGRGRGVRINLPWRGLPHRSGDRSLASGQVERGRGGGRAGPAPGVGPGGAGPRYANVAHGGQLGALPARLGAPRPGCGRETRASELAIGRGPASPECSEGPGLAARSGASPRGRRAPAQQPGRHSAIGPS